MSLNANELETIEENWNRVKSEIAAKWPELSKSDLKLIDGDSQKLVALVHQRTNSSLPEIQSAIDEIAVSSNGALSRVMNSLQSAAEYLPSRTVDFAAKGEQLLNEEIERRPLQTLSKVFGTGVALGVCMAGLTVLWRGRE